MRIIVIGSGEWFWYEEAFYQALIQLGHEVKKFTWHSKFTKFISGNSEPVPISTISDLQNRAIWGPKVYKLNREFLSAIKEFVPDLIIVYRGTHILTSTLRKIKSQNKKPLLIHYCNDDPFTPGVSKILWRHVKKSIPLYDFHFVYRKHNINDFLNTGGKHAELLRSYYLRDYHYHVEVKSDSKYNCEVVFAGHYERDFRTEYLETILGKGIKVNVFGGGWTSAERYLNQKSPIRQQFPIQPAVGEDYRRAISGAKIALCFLSKINRDTYTRRVFEIPAIGTFLLSEYSDDMASIFREGEEAEFFRTKDEFVDKIQYYLRNDSKRMEIARKGHERVISDGHDSLARVEQILCTLKNHNLLEGF